MVKWDKGLSFTYLSSSLKAALREEGVARLYAAIGLIQLCNGLRAGEAVDAFQYWLKTREQKFTVRVEKKRRPEERLVVIPAELGSVDLSKYAYAADMPRSVLLNRYKVFVHDRFGFNTHSLRYAFITYLLEQGVSPAIIARITAHSKLDFILGYTQKKRAEDILEKLNL